MVYPTSRKAQGGEHLDNRTGTGPAEEPPVPHSMTWPLTANDHHSRATETGNGLRAGYTPSGYVRDP